MIDKIINNVCAMIQDKRYYYSQNRENEFATDCSKLILDAIKKSGLPIGSASYTGNMSDLTKTNNFVKLPYTGKASLQRGDILVWHKGGSDGHTVLYIGSNKIAEAAGRKTGLRVTDFREEHWQYILRYSGSGLSSNLPPTIRKGDENIYVGLLQVFLNKYSNARLQVDCEFGPKTAEAVKNFQINKSLEVDGIVGVKTWSKVYTTMVQN